VDDMQAFGVDQRN